MSDRSRSTEDILRVNVANASVGRSPFAAVGPSTPAQPQLQNSFDVDMDDASLHSVVPYRRSPRRVNDVSPRSAASTLTVTSYSVIPSLNTPRGAACGPEEQQHFQDIPRSQSERVFVQQVRTQCAQAVRHVYNEACSHIEQVKKEYSREAQTAIYASKTETLQTAAAAMQEIENLRRQSSQDKSDFHRKLPF